MVFALLHAKWKKNKYLQFMLRLRLCIEAFISHLIWVYLLRPWGQISKTDTVMRSSNTSIMIKCTGLMVVLKWCSWKFDLTLYLQMHLGLLIKQEKETVEMLHFKKNKKKTQIFNPFFL